MERNDAKSKDASQSHHQQQQRKRREAPTSSLPKSASEGSAPRQAVIGKGAVFDPPHDPGCNQQGNEKQVKQNDLGRWSREVGGNMASDSIDAPIHAVSEQRHDA